MDTQAISHQSSGSVDINVEYPPYPVVKRNVFTDRERFELKEIIREVINEFIWLIVDKRTKKMIKLNKKAQKCVSRKKAVKLLKKWDKLVKA